MRHLHGRSAGLMPNPPFKSCITRSQADYLYGQGTTAAITAGVSDPDLAQTPVPTVRRQDTAAFFDTGKITNPNLRKIAETLRVYGANVVDRNVDTPFAIFVGNGADFSLTPKGWDNAVAGQLDLIRAGLRQALSANDWVGVTDKSIASAKAPKINILSMRGPCYKQSGTAVATYNTDNQQLEFAAGGTEATYVNANNTGMTKVTWAMPVAGSTIKLSSLTSGGASLRVQVRYNGVLVFDSSHLANS